MSAIGSLVFCNDCGNLLDGSAGKQNVILTCAACGAQCKGMRRLCCTGRAVGKVNLAQIHRLRLSLQCPNPPLSHRRCVRRDPRCRLYLRGTSRPAASSIIHAKNAAGRRCDTTHNNCEVQMKEAPSSTSATVVTSTFRGLCSELSVC